MPRYEHDCEDCRFLGEYAHFDLYFCDQGGHHPTVIARFSSEGGDYYSGLAFANAYLRGEVEGLAMAALAEAKMRAHERMYL